MNLSVIICTHNPRIDYLHRTLDALNAQTLPKDWWELIVVDNRSDEPLAEKLDLSWHPAARVVWEEKLGLTNARIRGCREASGEWLVYVDDDNLLDANYLKEVINFSRQCPFLKVFGAAVVEPDFEIEPSPDIMPWCGYLALRKHGQTAWCNSTMKAIQIIPFGAGMVVERNVMSKYVEHKTTGPIFDRVGKTNLNSSGDFEISLYAAKSGYGYGIYDKLRIKHLIGASRINRKYLRKLIFACEKSNYLLFALYQNEESSKIELLADGFKSLVVALKERGLGRTAPIAGWFGKVAGYWDWRKFHDFSREPSWVSREDI